MTIINFTFNNDEALIVTDTAISEAGKISGHATKCLSIPHLRLAVAASGEWVLVWNWLCFLMLGAPAMDVTSVDAIAPDELRHSWGKIQRSRPPCPTNIYLFGVNPNEEIEVYAYRSVDNFLSLRLQPGTYISPTMVENSLPSRPDDSEPSGDTLATAETPEAHKAPEPTRHQRMRYIIDVMPLQQGRTIAGGNIQCTTVTPWGIRQHWLETLPTVPALEAVA